MNIYFILAFTCINFSLSFPLFRREADIVVNTQVVYTTAVVTQYQTVYAGVQTTTATVSPTTTSLLDTTTNAETTLTSTTSINIPQAAETQAKPVLLANEFISQNGTVNDFYSTIGKIWSRFWVESGQNWNEDDSICGTGTYSQPVVWDQAVIGRAITDLKDTSKINSTIANIYQYKNPTLNAYSATEAGDDDIYNDDNAQVAWVFIDGYKITGNEEYLNSAQDIVDFLIGQWNPSTGGVIWSYNGDYIASISTTEAALAAMRLYSVTQNQTHLEFAENCMNFMFQYLQDPNDHLFYDGLDKNDITNVNDGKLTYTVGVGISTLAYLYQFTGNSKWLNSAIELGNAALNQNGAFYGSNKILNNPLKYVHLLYAGISDLLTIVPWQESFDYFRSEMIRQGNFVFDFLQDPADISLYFDSATGATQLMFNDYEAIYNDGQTFTLSTSIYCNNNVNNATQKVLLDNASAAQILYEVSRL
ncbi:glycosyl hydrolase family 76-domain-containing protein [Scheffersomyces coipomensis]|uniref:glycosyl hydrolase family 76-domain-containing protein n=1 Tax=Scheffersomyces coipomensis TaxID=1788519 RepID=UPI00315DCE3B